MMTEDHAVREASSKAKGSGFTLRHKESPHTRPINLLDHCQAVDMSIESPGQTDESNDHV